MKNSNDTTKCMNVSQLNLNEQTQNVAIFNRKGKNYTTQTRYNSEILGRPLDNTGNVDIENWVSPVCSEYMGRQVHCTARYQINTTVRFCKSHATGLYQFPATFD